MTSLRKYASRRHKASYYSLGTDPTIPTGTPVPEPIPSPAELAHSESRDFSAPIEDQINEPMGIVADIAREYARVRDERGPRRDTSAPVLDERALRRKRKQEQAKQLARERSIFWVQYRKLIDQRDYVNRVYKEMEEKGHFGGALRRRGENQVNEGWADDQNEPPIHGGYDDNSDDEAYTPRDEFVQGSSKGGTR